MKISNIITKTQLHFSANQKQKIPKEVPGKKRRQKVTLMYIKIGDKNKDSRSVIGHRHSLQIKD